MSEDVLPLVRPETAFRAARPVVVHYLWTTVVGAASAAVAWWIGLTWLPYVLGLGAAVTLWWLVSSLVGRVELGADVGALPNLCEAVNGAAADLLGTDVEPVVADVGPGEQKCGCGNGSRSLVLTAHHHLRSGLHSGSSMAAVSFTGDVELVAEPKAGRSISVPGFADLGDGAAATVTDSIAFGMIRQANVVMTIVLRAGDSDALDDTDHDNLLRFGQAAVNAVR